jgi:ribosomal protein L7/L12
MDLGPLEVVILLVFLGVPIGLIFLAVTLINRRTPPLKYAVPEQHHPLPPEVIAHLQQLIQTRKKIQAIKEIRILTGLGLKEAKDVADALEAGRYDPAAPNQPRSLPPELLAHLQRLLAARKKIEAIKEIRTHTGLGLKEAKHLAEAIEDGRFRPVATPLSERVRAFKSVGDHASALALVRAETGMSPTEAERFIQALES